MLKTEIENIYTYGKDWIFFQIDKKIACFIIACADFLHPQTEYDDSKKTKTIQRESLFLKNINYKKIG